MILKVDHRLPHASDLHMPLIVILESDELPTDQESQTGSSGDTESIRGGMVDTAESAGVAVTIDTSGKSLDVVATELVAMVIHNAMLELQNEVCN